MFNKFIHKVTSIFILISLVFCQFFINVEFVSAQKINDLNINIEKQKITDWYEIDKLLVEQMRRSLQNTEKFADEELDNYIDKLMVNVDEKFLNWYFNFWYQKAIEYGGVLGWVVLKLDEPLKVFRQKDEKKLNSSEVIKKRLTEDFYNKFQELVFTESSQKEFSKIIERAGNLYGNSLALVFAQVKDLYKIPDQDWNNHLGTLASLIYDTGNSKGSLNPDSFGSTLLTETGIIGALIGTKLFTNFVIKVGGKLAAKSGASLAVSATQLIDPFLAIGFIAWDVWDYNKMVTNSRPILRKNILDYLSEFKYQTLQDPKIGIIPNLEVIQGELIQKLRSASSQNKF